MFKSPFKTATVLLLGSVFLAARPGWADLRYDQTTTNEYHIGQAKKIQEVSHQKVYIKDQKIRIENKEDGKVILIRFDREKLYELNSKNKNYTEKSFQELKKAQGSPIPSQQVAPQRNVGMQAARKQLGKLADGLSPERRSFMEQMMLRQQALMMGKAQVPAMPTVVASGKPVIVKETTQVKEINGFSCRRVKVVQGKKKIIDMWVTTQGGPPKNYFAQIIETLGLFNPEVISAVKVIEGFPIKQKYRIQTGPLAGTLQAVATNNFDNSKLSDDLFEIPKGYSKIVPAEDSFDEDEEESFF